MEVHIQSQQFTNYHLNATTRCHVAKETVDEEEQLLEFKIFIKQMEEDMEKEFYSLYHLYD
eukprot:Pgem_evm1s7365